ncbi:MAG: hypothetical protein KDB22_13410 [Planctomycetales bacterium]|nr:hypothetical protein [Planctomycetales bacterium]
MSAAVNLIPAGLVTRFRLKRVKRLWYRIAVIACSISGCIVLSGRLSLAERLAAITREESDSSRPREVHREHLSLLRESKRLDQYIQTQHDLRSRYDSVAVFALLTEIKHQLAGNLDVQSVSFSLDDGADQKFNGTVMMEVVTEGTSNSSNFLQLLKDSGFFRSVSLSSSLQKLDQASDALRFSVRCDF